MAAPLVDEVSFPVDLSRGASGGPEWRTVLVTSASGAEQRVQQWADPRSAWTITVDQRDVASFQTLLAFWYARRGRARGFRFKDWSDYAATNEPLYPAGQNSANPVKGSGMAQLVKSYADTVLPYTRNIYKPVSGTVSLRKNGSALGGISVDTTTGLVTLAAVVTQSITGISQAASAVVTFGAAPVFVVGDLVSFSGVGGMTAINGLVGQVTAAGGSTITVNINSSSFSAYASGGTASKYAASTDSFDASFQFEVPVRFDSDAPGFVQDDVAIRSMSQIRVVELLG